MNGCGITGCPREGSSVDPRFGRLCGFHNKRVRDASHLDDPYARIVRDGDEKYLKPLDVYSFDQEKCKQYICEPDLDVRLRPLLLFVASHTIGQSLIKFNFTRALMDL